MMLRQAFLLPSYLMQAARAEFAWGQWDCNTFISRWIDYSQGENSSDEIVGKYSTALQAARFYKRYITYDTYLKRWGYHLANGDYQTGDVVIDPTNLWAAAHIVYGDSLYSMDPKKNLIKVPLSIVPLGYYETWRL